MTIPEWLLERYAVGEVTAEERAVVEADPDLAERLAELRADNQAILQTYPAAVVARRASARPAPARRPGWQLLAAPVLLAATALVAVLWLAPPDDGHRPKGLGAGITVHRQIDGGSEVLEPGARAEQGDRLQLEIRSDSPFGWVLSIDGAGAVTVHNDGRVEPGISRLATAYVLDDAPAFERFFLVSSDSPIPRREIVERADAFAADPDPERAFEVPGATSVDVVLVKP